LIVSDIHANLIAFETVLADVNSYDAVWCLGDIVGYGPDPNECVELIQTLPGLTCLMGNHDAAAIKKIDTDSFNPEARASIIWTQNQLRDETKSYLLELQKSCEFENVTLAHGSPRHPIWEYLMDTTTANQNFEYFATPFCFVGHSHLPVLFKKNESIRFAELNIPIPNKKIDLMPRMIVNPGSVGQPRDRDPRAAYAIFDTESNNWDYRRIIYDIHSVQQRMESALLPERHIMRLSDGW